MTTPPSPTPYLVHLRREASGSVSNGNHDPDASPPSWVILGSVARVSTMDADIPPKADLSVALQAPPHVVDLVISRRIFPFPQTPQNYPTVVATDPSGLVLLHADQGPASGSAIIDFPKRKEVCWPLSVPGYFVIDATSATATPLPKTHVIMHPEPGFLGLVASPKGGGHYMVAELQYTLNAKDAKILCFSSEVGDWVEKTVSNPIQDVCNHVFAPNGGVISFFDRLWWVDHTSCILTCNVLAEKPMLRVVELPPGKEVDWWAPCGLLHKKRWVGVSAGSLYFVDIYNNFNSLGAPQVSVWILEGYHEWKLKQEASFVDILDNKTYKRANLPRKMPNVALMDPVDSSIIYFEVDKLLYGVDVRTQEVVRSKSMEIATPPHEHFARHHLLAWQLPQALSTGKKGQAGGASRCTAPDKSSGGILQ